MSDDLLFAGADPIDDEPLASENFDDGFIPDEDDEDAGSVPYKETEPKEEAEEAEETEEVEEAEEEAEETEEAEEETEEEPEPEPEPDTKRIQVPKDRLDAEIAKRRELEARLREFEQAKGLPETAITGLEGLPDPTTMFDEVLNGDLEKAAAIYRQSLEMLAKATAKSVKDELTAEINAMPGRTRAETELQAEANRIAAEYDVFNENSEAFDETLTNEVLDLRNYYADKGHTMVDALRKAVSIVAKSEGLAPKTAKATPKTPTRKTQPNIDQKIKAANAQPPKTGGERNTSEEPALMDISKMSDEDMDKLSEIQLARLRGDYL